MSGSLKSAVFVQIVYLALAILVALVVWGILGEYESTAKVPLGNWRLGGPLAGVVAVYLLLYRGGLVDKFIELSGKTVKAEVLLTPVDTEAYGTLFNGYDNCDYIAFNSPFKVEEAGQILLDEALAIHEKRYLKDNVKSRYLLCDRESYERAKEFFDKLADRIGKEVLDANLQICQAEGTQPGYTYFGGTKDGKAVCVIYPAAKFREGLPEAVVYLENAPKLLTLLRSDFEERWREAKET
jgi:hypothetical protein